MIKRSLFTGSLLDHQQEAIDKLDKSDALLLYHNLGSGKTVTSIAGSEGDNIDVVTPASLRENYKKEITKFTKRPSKRNVISYNRFTSHGPSPEAKTLIMDEVQRIGRSESKMSQSAVESARYYDKRILLSGTPALNSPRELAPIIRMLSPDATSIPLDTKGFNKKFMEEKKIPVSFFRKLRGIRPGVSFEPINVDEIKKSVLGKIHYYKSSKDDFPDRRDEIKEVEASKEQSDIYRYVTNKASPILALKVRMNIPLSKKELKSINSFMGAARQVSNTTKPYGGKEKISNKIKEVVSDIKAGISKNRNHKSLVYSNYIDSGINQISNQLDKENISYSVF